MDGCGIEPASATLSPARWIDRGHTAGHTPGTHFSTSLGVPDIVELCSVSSKSLIYKDFGGFGGKLS